MNRALRQGLVLVAWTALAGTAGAQALQEEVVASVQRGGDAAPLVSGTPLPVMGAEEPKRLAPAEVHAYRDERQPCDPRHGTGREACRAQLAAKYADMDRLCRIAATGSELPVCIRNAYAAD